MFLNKNEELDEEQGFIKAKQQILIDYKCMFYSLPKNFRCNPFSKKLKQPKIKLHSIEHIKNSLFINQAKRQQSVNEIVKKCRQNIIFNDFNNQIGQSQPNITFDATFPMSNLQVVTRVKSCNYQLYMRPDTNTNTHFQWFYFRVHIIKKKKVKFTIKNFIKATMLYSKGLRPFYYSKKQENYKKFTQIKQQVTFTQDPQTQFYSLSFSFQFKDDNDQVYFSSQPPYGYEDLEQSLSKIRNAKRSFLGKTVLSNKIPCLVFNQKAQTKAIGIAIARQHPGETVGSWMMEGFLRQLSKDNIPRQVQWVVIPMVNIDGVELGNNRTGVLGHDFNRNWNIDEGSRKEKMFPQIASILSYIRKLKKKYPKKLRMFLDLHGHSSEQNVFAYGPQHLEKTDFYFMSRLFPELLTKKNQNFKLQQSSYKINNDKKNAARSVMLNQFKIPFSYTIECTFGVMNSQPVSFGQIIKVGQDIAFAANQFLEHLYVKNSHPSSINLIQQIKQKYVQHKHQANQYESAGESSQDTPDRKQFQMNIQELLADKISKRLSATQLLNTGIGSHKVQYQKCERKNSEESLRLKNKQSLNDETLRVINKFRSSNKKTGRVVTQGCHPEIYNECAYFPPVKSRHNSGKSPILDKFNTVIKQKQQMPGMMNMKEIQQRLFKLRNSRIGKKILVINAYGV